MIQVYVADIRKLPDPRECPDILSEITKERRERIMRYLQPGDRKRSLGAGLLLQKVLPRHGAEPAKVRLGANGKPQAEGLCFNVSHSGSWAVCAVGRKPVGCDVERVVRAPERVAERFFHPNEAAYIRQCRAEERDTAFFRIWTMKESYVKMTGEGLRLPLNSIEFSVGPDGIGMFREGERLSCHIREYALPGYRVSVCAEEARFAESLETVEIG